MTGDPGRNSDTTPTNGLGWQPSVKTLIDDKRLSAALANPAERPLSRKDASRLVDFLIDYLDTLDSDPDLEDGGDAEPWLGWAASGAIGGVSDCEEQCDDEGDQSDTGIGDHDGLMEQCAGHRAVSGAWAGRTRYEPYVS